MFNNGAEYFRKKYGHEIGGIWVPRVTAITEIINKPALLRYYAAQKSFEDAQRKLRNSADWGTLTHNTIEKLFKGLDIEIDPKIKPSIDAFHQWKDEHGIEVKDVEKRVFDSDNLYAGRLDALINIDGDLGILDIKTGTGIWDEYSLQLAAYLNAHNKMVDKKEQASKRWILRVEQYKECMICGAKARIKSGEAVIKGGDPFCDSHRLSV